MRILVVEDEFKIADVIASRLKKENYIVDVFSDGEDGLDNALTNIYDLIILDVMLPKVNGFTILAEIRREKIVDENEKVVFAYKADRNISTLVYSSSNLTDQDYTVYAGNSIEGKLDSNNVYTEITSLDLQNMTKQENSSDMGGPMRLNNGFQERRTETIKSNELEPNTKIAKMILIFLIILIIAIAVTAAIAAVKRK